MTEAYAAEWIDFEKDLGYRPVLDGDIGTILKQWESLGKDLVSKFPMKGFDTSVQRDDRIVTQSGNRVRIYTSPSVKNSNLCIYIHGGGWAMGDIDSEDAQCVEFCKRSKMIVVSIEYRLSPEHKFPIPLDDCVELYDWAVAHASTFDCLAERIVLAGGSAGANLALAVALRLIDEGHHRSPDGLFLAVPVTVDPRLIPKELEGRHTSYVDNADTGPNSPGGMIGFADAYGPPLGHKYLSVLLHEKIHRLPRTYIAIACKDTLRDDGRLLVEKLREGGVQVNAKEYAGLPHYFWTWPGSSLKDVSEQFHKDSHAAMTWLLS